MKARLGQKITKNQTLCQYYLSSKLRDSHPDLN